MSRQPDVVVGDERKTLYAPNPMDPTHPLWGCNCDDPQFTIRCEYRVTTLSAAGTATVDFHWRVPFNRATIRIENRETHTDEIR